MLTLTLTGGYIKRDPNIGLKLGVSSRFRLLLAVHRATEINCELWPVVTFDHDNIFQRFLQKIEAYT